MYYFWDVVVPASDPKVLFMECVTSFADIWGRRIACEFLDIGDAVDLSPSLSKRGDLCRL
jgi:hypothetical protein